MPTPVPPPAALAPTREYTWERYDAELAAAAADAHAVSDGLTAPEGIWRPAPGRWSVAECLAHLAATSGLYLPVLDDALRRGRRDAVAGAPPPFRPGFASRMLVSAMEPPPRRPLRAAAAIAPPPDVSLAEARDRFETSQRALRDRVAAAATVDLARVRLRSPILPLLRMRLGTCFGFLAAHQRRHLWQAHGVRAALR